MQDVKEGQRWLNKRSKRRALVYGLDTPSMGMYQGVTFVTYRYDEPLRKEATDYTQPFVQSVRVPIERFLKSFTFVS